MTRTVKIYVHIGSAILACGQYHMMKEAIITPIDYSISPKTWTIAALILIFSSSIGLEPSPSIDDLWLPLPSELPYGTFSNYATLSVGESSWIIEWVLCENTILVVTLGGVLLSRVSYYSLIWSFRFVDFLHKQSN